MIRRFINYMNAHDVPNDLGAGYLVSIFRWTIFGIIIICIIVGAIELS